MWEILKLIALGIVEGITEFMPVSSTAHLILAQKLLALQVNGDAANRILDIFPQIGCALAVMLFYRQKIFYLLKHMFTLRDTRLTIRNLILATAPLLLAPLLIKFLPYNTNSVWLLAENLIIGAIIIFILETYQHTIRTTTIADISTVNAVLIGLAQLLAIFPGVSRSGATIVAALFLHIDRKTAVTFSFLLSIPAIMGAGMLEAIENHAVIFVQTNISIILVSTLTAFIVSLLVMKPLIDFLSTHKLVQFGWYRLGLGIILLLLTKLSIL